MLMLPTAARAQSRGIYLRRMSSPARLKYLATAAFSLPQFLFRGWTEDSKLDARAGIFACFVFQYVKLSPWQEATEFASQAFLIKQRVRQLGGCGWCEGSVDGG